MKPELPKIPGNECVAEVLKCGPEVKLLKKGDLVVPVASGLGTWRSHAIWDEKDVIKVPENVGINEAAGIAVRRFDAEWSE